VTQIREKVKIQIMENEKGDISETTPTKRKRMSDSQTEKR
jgi:hypothetical protein